MGVNRVVSLGMLLGLGLAGVVWAGSEQKAPRPPGHPLSGSRPYPSAPVPPPPGSGRGGGKLIWTVPKGWVSEPPTSSMRRAQYRTPGSAGAGECVVFYFGPGQGGSAEANAARWASQFRQADGQPVPPPKTAKLDVGGIPVLRVEVAGTYSAGMPGGPPVPDRPDQILLGAIAEAPDANWYFRCTGPRATMLEQQQAFDQLIRSVRVAQ